MCIRDRSTTTTAWRARHWHSHCAPNLDRRVVIRGRVVMLINVDEGSGPYDRRYVDRSGILWCVRERLLREWSRALYFELSLIHISEPTRLLSISYAVFCLKKKKKTI